jgi:hypothetical protein
MKIFRFFAVLVVGLSVGLSAMAAAPNGVKDSGTVTVTFVNAVNTNQNNGAAGCFLPANPNRIGYIVIDTGLNQGTGPAYATNYLTYGISSQAMVIANIVGTTTNYDNITKTSNAKFLCGAGSAYTNSELLLPIWQGAIYPYCDNTNAFTTSNTNTLKFIEFNGAR